MVALLGELVAAPTLLGREAPGQAVMRRAFAGLGLEPFDVPLDAAALERHPARRAVQLGARRQGERARRLAAAGRRPLADPQRPHRRRQPRAVVAVERRPVRAARRGRLDVRPRRRRHEGGPRGDGRRRAPACSGSGRGRAGGSSCSRWSRRSARATARSPACWPATRPTPRSSPSRRARRSGTPRSACCGSRCACSARRRTPATRPTGANAIEASYAVIEALRALEAELNEVKPAAVRGLSASDLPQRRDDPRRRLAVDGRGRVRDPLPARVLSGRAGRGAQGARRADRRRGGGGQPAALRRRLRRLPVRGLRARRPTRRWSAPWPTRPRA